MSKSLQPSASSSTTTVIPPPQCIVRDESTSTDQVLAKVSPKRTFPHRRRKTKNPKRTKTSRSISRAQTGDEGTLAFNSTGEVPFIKLGEVPIYDPQLEEDYDKDVYKWAVLYENQRGVTIFSTPYYSSLSLLPTDPPPFTVPSTEKISRRHQPSVSFSTYPLPDGTWRWVSKTWMVDMRGDGQTQYDGYEYNWFFRNKHWRDQVGHFNAGGWVRRRRWVRLMVRPARPKGSPPNGGDALVNASQQDDRGATRPPSVMPSPGEEDDEDIERRVWTGDQEQDWERCHQELRRAPHDGRKLELWKQWLGLAAENVTLSPGPVSTKGKSRDFLDVHPVAGKTGNATRGQTIIPKVPTEYLRPVLERHGEEIIRSFVYPNSRGIFVEYLIKADLFKFVKAGMNVSDISQLLDFWSTSQTLNQTFR